MDDLCLAAEQDLRQDRGVGAARGLRREMADDAGLVDEPFAKPDLIGSRLVLSGSCRHADKQTIGNAAAISAWRTIPCPPVPREAAAVAFCAHLWSPRKLLRRPFLQHIDLGLAAQSHHRDPAGAEIRDGNLGILAGAFE